MNYNIDEFDSKIVHTVFGYYTIYTLLTITLATANHNPFQKCIKLGNIPLLIKPRLCYSRECYANLIKYVERVNPTYKTGHAIVNQDNVLRIKYCVGGKVSLKLEKIKIAIENVVKL